MEASTTDRLTLGYLHKLSRYNYIATAAATLMALVSTFWILFQLSGESGTATFASMINALTAAITAIWTLQTVYLAHYGALRLERHRRIGGLLIVVGQLISTIASIYTDLRPAPASDLVPFIVDIISLLSYPFFFIGLVVLFSPRRFRLRTALDACIITICLLGICWFFLLGPTYIIKIDNTLSLPHLLKLATALAYPIGDTFISLTLLLLLLQGMEPILRLSLSLIGVSAILNLWADLAYAYTSVFTGTYHTGTAYIDPFWIASYLLFGLATLYYYNTLARRAYNERLHPSKPTSTHMPLFRISPVSSRWRQLQHLFVFVPIIILLGLVVIGELTHTDRLIRPISILAILVGALVAIRQISSTREQETLLKEREQRYRDAERLQYIVTHLTEEHDMTRLRELVVSMATSELGFEVSMLLLAETYKQPGQSRLLQTHLFANVASKSTHPKQWRLRGDTILHRTSVATQKMRIVWGQHLAGIPQDLITWGEDESIASMLFFPLIYQDKILGSLGVARPVWSHLSIHDQEIAQAYTDQVASVIEHALLYQEAREHAEFAHALATIATRLNAAAAEPAEISQLICQEGARALKADYVLLYTAGENGILMPLAICTNEMDTDFSLSDCPSFHLSSYEKRAQHAPLPILLEIAPQATQSKITRPLTLDEINIREINIHEQRTLVLRHKLVQHGVHTAIMAPLTAGGKIIGMLILSRALSQGSRDKRPFDASDLSNTQDFAKQAGVAFNNALLYQHVQSANQQLQELDRLKDQFMVTASHELRTPLTAVQGYIELMAQYDEMLPADQRREFLQKAQRGCEELVILLGNVMDASRLEIEAGVIATQIQAISLQEMIEDLLILIEPQTTQERREVHVQVPIGLFVYADPVRFRQVLMNISVNALKYSEPGTPLSITAQPLFEQSQALISIADQGKGIAPEYHGRLFQRFFRLESDINSPIRGSGLGLYISQRLLEAMGGKIWLESQGIPGEGSIFHIQLPLA